MKKFKYHSPKSLDESRKIFMSCEFPQYLAGGMTLLPSIKQGLSSPTDLIDLAHINDMKGINEDNNNISVGSLVNHNEIAKSHLIKKYISGLAYLASKIADSIAITGAANKAFLIDEIEGLNINELQNFNLDNINFSNYDINSDINAGYEYRISLIKSLIKKSLANLHL